MIDGLGNNPERGCGTKVAGGFYAETTFSILGNLYNCVHMVGEQIVDGVNCTIGVPSRGHIVANLAGTLLAGYLWESVNCDLPGYTQLQRQIGSPAVLLDHVGASHYTAHSFAVELQSIGPSRRVTKAAAMEIARLTPIPIVFTHRIPIFPDGTYLEAMRDLLLARAKPYFGTAWNDGGWKAGATWLDPTWGLTTEYEDTGKNHIYLPTLQVLDYLRNSTDEDLKAAAAKLMADATMMEMPFCSSWITQVNYYKTDSEASGIIEGIERAGIVVNDLDAPCKWSAE